MNTSNSCRRLATLALVASTALAVTSTVPAEAKATTKKAKAVKTTKTASTARAATVTTKAAPAPPPKRAFDLNRCTYLDTEAVSAIVGSPVVLDTSPGDAGSNTHAYSENFEQCVYNLAVPDESRSRMQLIVHVQRKGQDIHQELVNGQWNSPCPAACVTVPGLGDSAVVTARFGDGGGFTSGAWGHLHVLKGTTRVYVAVAPKDDSVNNGAEHTHADQIDPAQRDRSVKIAQIVLPHV